MAGLWFFQGTHSVTPPAAASAAASAAVTPPIKLSLPAKSPSSLQCTIILTYKRVEKRLVLQENETRSEVSEIQAHLNQSPYKCLNKQINEKQNQTIY